MICSVHTVQWGVEAESCVNLNVSRAASVIYHHCIMVWVRYDQMSVCVYRFVSGLISMKVCLCVCVCVCVCLITLLWVFFMSRVMCVCVCVCVSSQCYGYFL